jgi:acyl carrier protein
MESGDARVRSSLRDHVVERWLNGDARGLDDETDLQLLGVLDSFSTLDVVAFLGEAFQVEIEPSDINSETFRSISTIARLVSDELAARDSRQRPAQIADEEDDDHVDAGNHARREERGSDRERDRVQDWRGRTEL